MHTQRSAVVRSLGTIYQDQGLGSHIFVDGLAYSNTHIFTLTLLQSIRNSMGCSLSPLRWFQRHEEHLYCKSYRFGRTLSPWSVKIDRVALLGGGCLVGACSHATFVHGRGKWFPFIVVNAPNRTLARSITLCESGVRHLAPDTSARSTCSTASHLRERRYMTRCCK
jgi:hypothetical protein